MRKRETDERERRKREGERRRTGVIWARKRASRVHWDIIVDFLDIALLRLSAPLALSLYTFIYAFTYEPIYSCIYISIYIRTRLVSLPTQVLRVRGIVRSSVSRAQTHPTDGNSPPPPAHMNSLPMRKPNLLVIISANL